MPALPALHVREGDVAVLVEPVLPLRRPRGRHVQAQLALGLLLVGQARGGVLWLL